MKSLKGSSNVVSTGCLTSLNIVENNREIPLISTNSLKNVNNANIDEIDKGRILDTEVPSEQKQPKKSKLVTNVVPLSRRGGCIVTEMWPKQMELVRRTMFEDPVHILCNQNRRYTIPNVDCVKHFV